VCLGARALLTLAVRCRSLGDGARSKKGTLMHLHRAFAFSLALTTIIGASVGCSSSSPPAAEDAEALDQAQGDGDDVTLATADEETSIDPAEEGDEDDALSCTAGDPPVYETAMESVSAGPLAVRGAAADVDVDGDAADDGDEVDGIPEEVEERPFPAAAAEALAAAIPSKIRYVLVLIKENHTFDNYFTGFPGATWSKKAKLDASTVIRRPVAPNGDTGAPCHSNACGQHAYANGAMDGFDQRHEGLTPFTRYTEAQIPNYWKYAREFVLADHFFSTTLGPSSPGHEVFWFGRSTTLDNPKCNLPGGTGCAGVGCTADKHVTATGFNPLTCSTEKVRPCFNLPSLPDHLPRGFTWMDYGGPMAMQIKSVVAQPDFKTHFRKANKLVEDLGKGQLANLTIAHLSGGDVSEHPPAGPCVGENFTVDIVNAAMKLPQWKEMAIVVTWDDWGGFYDHVKPPVHKCKNGKVFESGFRLPLLILSPYAKKGHVLKTRAEQASVPRLVEELWGMPFMSKRNRHARDGIAGSLLGAFDFKQAPRAPLHLAPRAHCP